MLYRTAPHKQYPRILCICFISVFLHDASVSEDTLAMLDTTDTEIDVIPSNTSLPLIYTHLDPTKHGLFQLRAIFCQHIRDGAILFVADIPCNDLLRVASVLKDEQVPMLNLNEKCSAPVRNETFYFDYETPKREFKQGVTQALRSTGWHDVLLIRDTHEGRYI